MIFTGFTKGEIKAKSFLEAMFFYVIIFFKVHMFWEGHKILQILCPTFDYRAYSQKLGEDFPYFVAFTEYMNFT